MASVTPHFKLTLGGLTSTTDRAVGGPTRILVMRDMDGAAELLEVELADRRGVAPGDDASVELGYDGQTQTVYTGKVVEVVSSLAGARVIAFGRMYALLRLRLARRWEDRSAGAIVRDLAGEAGVGVGQADDGPTLPRYAVDRRIDVAAHLRELARRLGFELYTDRDGKLMFRALGAAANLDSGGFGGRASAAAGAAASLLGGGSAGGYEVGKQLIAARATQRAPRIQKVEVAGEGPASSHGDQSSWWLGTDEGQNHGSAGSGDAVLTVFDAAARTKDLAERFAAGTLATVQRGTHTLWLRTMGRAAVELGDAIRVGAADDDALNAQGYVRALTHRCTARAGFTTEITVEVAG